MHQLLPLSASCYDAHWQNLNFPFCAVRLGTCCESGAHRPASVDTSRVCFGMLGPDGHPAACMTCSLWCGHPRCGTCALKVRTLARAHRVCPLWFQRSMHACTCWLALEKLVPVSLSQRRSRGCSPCRPPQLLHHRGTNGTW